MPSPHQISQQELIDEMLERLANTPLQRNVVKLDEDGEEEVVTIDETQRVFWAMNFIDKFAKEKGLKGV